MVFLIDPTFLNFWISIVPLNIEISLLIEMWELGSNRRKKKKNAKKQQEILNIFITFYVRFCYLCLNNKVSLLGAVALLADKGSYIVADLFYLALFEDLSL